MAQKSNLNEDAYQVVIITQGSDCEASHSESGSESDPTYSSDTFTDSSGSDDEEVPAKIRRTRPPMHRGSTSLTPSSVFVASTSSGAVVPNTSDSITTAPHSAAQFDNVAGSSNAVASTSSAAQTDIKVNVSSDAVETGLSGSSSAAASTSSAIDPDLLESSYAALAKELASDSDYQPPRSRSHRSHTNLPEALANPNWLPPDSAAPAVPPFTAQPGIKVPTENLTTPLQFFELFFTEDVCNLIVTQSNTNVKDYITANPNSFLARPFEWKPITVPEFKTFLALTLNMGITKKNELRSYWSTDPIHHMPVFSAAMSRKRYETIMQCLHFSDDKLCQPPDDNPNDKLHKIRPLINVLTQKFEEMYSPQQNICIDKSFINFNERLDPKPLPPSHSAKNGVKVYKLCESSTGYTYSFRIYESKDGPAELPGCPEYIGNSGRIVWDLMQPLFLKGYHLYVDSFYSSVPLFRHMFLQKTVCCGTMRPNRKGFPQRLVNTPLKKGERACLRNEELLAVKWKNKNDLYLLSSIHSDTTVFVCTSSGDIEKPLCVHDFNLNIGGVDFNDQMMKPYLAARKTRHWSKKVLIYLFQLALYNSYVIYISAGRTGVFLKFQEAIISALLYPDGSVPRSAFPDAVSRLHDRHFPDVLPSTQKQRAPQKRCRVCGKNGKRRDTRYICPSCPGQPGLCVKDCFRRYHTLVNF